MSIYKFIAAATFKSISTYIYTDVDKKWHFSGNSYTLHKDLGFTKGN